MVGGATPTFLKSRTGASPTAPSLIWTSPEKAESYRSSTDRFRRRGDSDSSPPNRRYRHSRATNLGQAGYHFLLSGRADVEAQVFARRQASTFDRLCADVGKR